MLLMLAGFVTLLVLQQVYSSPTASSRLAGQFGASGYRVGLGALALAALALILLGRTQIPYQFVWFPPPWLRALVLPLMFFAFILTAASLVPSNLRRLSRRPVLWGVVLWAIAHLLTKENLGAITLFSGFGILALCEIAAVAKRTRTARDGKLPLSREFLTVGVGGTLFIVVFFAHGTLFGISPAMMSRPFG